jgi:SAM-dependent methyltransferase
MTAEAPTPALNLTNWWKTSFESDVYRIVQPAERGPAVLAAELSLLPQWLHVSPGQSVLDVACGDGRLAVPLAAAGYKVIGLDQSPKLLSLAKRRFPETQGRLELVTGDMRAFQLPKPVDAVACVFASFGMFLDERDHVKTLQAFHAALKPGGRLYLEVFNPFYFVHAVQQAAPLSDGVLVYESVLDHRRGRLNSQVHLGLTGKPLQTVTLSWRAFGLWEIVRLLDAAGFHLRQANGGIESPDEFQPLRHNVLGLIAERKAATETGTGPLTPR